MLESVAFSYVLDVEALLDGPAAVVGNSLGSWVALAPRVVGRPFQKGRSGTPVGRPKGLARKTRELIGDDGTRVCEYMAAVLDDETERTEVRMEAGKWLVDRGFGKTPLTMEGEGAGDYRC